MKEYVSKSSKPEIVELVAIANKAKERYFSKDYFGCVKISKDFFNKYNLFNLGKTKFIKSSNENNHYNEEEDLFSQKFKSSSKVKFVEYFGAQYRANLYQIEEIYPESAQHTINLIEWVLYDSGYISEDNLDEQLREERDFFFKDTSKVYFPKEGMNEYSDDAKLVYRNAYRYEFLIHGIKIYTDGYSSIHYDMYIPLILGRMCIEQFVKIKFEKEYNGIDKPKITKVSGMLEKLRYNSIIPKLLASECKLVINRGNCNTHNSEASFPFALMHTLKTIKRILTLLK